MLFDKLSARWLHLVDHSVMGAPLNALDMATFDAPGAEGTTAYPALGA